MTEVSVPALSLVVLVGISGSGKSTFAARHFRPTQVISSDFCRGLVADDENDQTATPEAFDLLHHIVGTRLRRGLLTVVDATNVQWEARKKLIELARAHDVLADAIVLDVPEEVAVARNAARPDRAFGPHVVVRQRKDLRRSLAKIARDGFRRVHVLRGEEIDDAVVTYERAWTDRTELTGPFDLIGDVHGCRSELETLLRELGWSVTPTGATHPEGRTAVFVGDLVDRGPDTPGVLRLVMGMAAAGTALVVCGNHEQKLVRALDGRKVRVAHGLERSLEQLAAEPEEFRAAARAFMDGLISHYRLDGGRLVVAHAGLKEAYHGRASARVRAFALYGDTTGETDEYGLPVRYPWADDYRGRATVVYGHTPTTEPEWVNNTICLDTGVVFGGRLTALRYPERRLVSVPAERVWYEPARPLEPRTGRDARDPGVLDIGDVDGTRFVETRHGGRIKVAEENSRAALEIMSRFAVDPRWLVYLPPTMAPPETSRLDGYLEHPAEAFEEFARTGVIRVVCEEKHMGSRAIAVLARTPEVAAKRFGVADGSAGSVFTRTGRPFFGDRTAALVDRLRAAVAPLWEELNTDWVVLDCELLPWSAKAEGLIRDQYASVGAAAAASLPAALAALESAAGRGLDVGALLDRTRRRAANASLFRDAYARYCWPVSGLDGVRLAPFQILACEGRATAVTEPHEWHLDLLGRLDADILTPTRHVFVSLDSPDERAAAVAWWEALTAAGGEGMVVKPAEHVPGRVQPGVKVRGREYLRIIYGPDYTDALDVLRRRFTGRKRSLALREHALGLEALERLAEGEPLWRIHEAVFAVLALESEPVDPRL
ncbi:polynucleotide kinase-phosphatase [Microbispora sp. ATCC PTA-5024]|uniref:polynucleotide kinase-phosphatase n=1 Tax=Microbispora sp. ATCC PTA-5024 TaxID=316330 RepID=UPI0003DDE801|nr:polynucleotide kinase-phosphatase [Microbispora sp. ATCC PTA-5024]ETK32416.1 metallophosphoesterase [Microbispora sp. ATCC PTA-5024]